MANGYSTDLFDSTGNVCVVITQRFNLKKANWKSNVGETENLSVKIEATP